MNTEIGLKATELVFHEQLRAHEAGHATAAALLDLDVRAVVAPPITFEDTLTGDPEALGGRVEITDLDDHPREAALATLAGPLLQGEGYWPPTWPLSLAPLTNDELKVGKFVRALGLDEAGYADLIEDARTLIDTPTFKALHGRIMDALADPPHTLRREEIRHHLKIAKEANVEHLTLKATTTITDVELGQFEAIVSAWTVDRERDVIDRGAFDATLKAWQQSGKMLPLLFEHTTEAVGFLDPATMYATDAGLVAAGQVDRSTETGQQVWRQIKSGSIGFSVGFMGTAEPRPGGGQNIVAIDLLEVSATSRPMHPAARVLSWKSATVMDDAPAGFDAAAVRAEWSARMQKAMGAADPAEALRAKAVRVADEVAPPPVRVARFEC